MKNELLNVLQRVGWDELYGRYIKDLAPVNARAERRACSPFPDLIDRNASFSVNVNSGLWNCFKSERGGDYIRFRAIIDAEDFDPATGLAIEDYAKAERTVMQEMGLSKKIDPVWIDSCRDLLYTDLLIRNRLQSYKPWHQDVMYQLKVGYSPEHDRFVFPVYDRRGKLVNCRMYRPGHDPKMIWLESNAGGNFIWPQVGWREKSVILVEGETDALTLRSFGFPAISGTLGAGHPVPDGEWWRDRHVYVCMDDDAKGKEASDEACRRLIEIATEVRVVKLPSWPGKPEKADISDYIIHLLTLSYQFEQIQRSISQLLSEAEVVESPKLALDQPAIDASFASALSSANLNQRVRFVARVTAKSTNRFLLPITYSVMCPAEGHAYCKKCPMHEHFHGNARFIHDARSITSLKLIQTTQEKQLEVIKELHGIVKGCTDPRHTITQTVDVEAVIINSSMMEGEANVEDVERQRREAYVITGGVKLEENRDYVFEGFVYPHPKSQHGVFLIDSAKPHESIYESFSQTKDVYDKLRMFQPSTNQTVSEKLVDVCIDLMNSVTMIKGRLDLHLAYRCVWYSSLAFNFSGKYIHRGWIEALVLGDTRCGKSDTFRQLARYYGVGVLIDCKMQSIPGILGTVVQSASGEYYVVAGMLPQQDGRVVCFDEFTVPKYVGQSIIEILSSTRSEGIVRINKAASAEFKARVRSIWLANPGGGRLISQSSDCGVELIHRLITQPEDIARFDLALTVSQTDVPADVINNLSRPASPKYSQEVAKTLLAWTYSRKTEQIIFTQQSEAAIIDLAIRMHNRYDSSIPLVEIADQRTRIAKLAVSVAAQCFSTDAAGEQIIVTEAHVEAVEQLYATWYDKPVMGYNTYSERMRVDCMLLDQNEVLSVFNQIAHPHGFRLAEELLRLDEVTERTLGTIVPIEALFQRSILQILYKNRAIHLMHRGKREAYEKTPAFTSFLKNYLASAHENTSRMA